MDEYVKIKLPKNLLAVLTVILAVVLIAGIVLFLMGNLTYSNNKISENQAGTDAVNFINSQINTTVTLENITEISGIYQIYVSYNGQSLPIYSTKDGKYLLQGIIPIK